MVWTEECVLPLAAAGVYPKTRVWGSSEKTLHCFSATALLSGNSRRGWENSSGETALGSALDNNGNTLTKVVGPNTTSYAWDFENRMSSVTLPGSGGTVAFKYDPFGRRIYKSSSAGTSIYAYDDVNLIEETNASGAVVARYSQTQNIDEPLAMLRGGTTSYYQVDGLGSVTSLSNPAGALAQTYTLDSFGNQTASTGSLTNPFRYTGREFDSESSLYYMRARYFDPATGRFISEDPIGFGSDDIDFYRYAKNNSTNLVDPFGLNPGAPAIPWPWVLPYPIVSPWVRALGGFLGGVLGELAWPDATGIDDARAIPLSKTDPNPPCQKKGKWHCTASCHINNFSNRPNIPGFITGEGWGNSRSEAELAAEKNANANLSRLGTGIYKRHCTFKCEQR